MILPTANAFSKIADGDQGPVLDAIKRDLALEIEGLKFGTIFPDHRGAAHAIRNAQARNRRLTRLAHDFGYWLKDDQTSSDVGAELRRASTAFNAQSIAIVKDIVSSLKQNTALQGAKFDQIVDNVRQGIDEEIARNVTAPI